MKRLMAILVAAGLFGAMLVGCHAEAGGGVGGNSTTSVMPGQ